MNAGVTLQREDNTHDKANELMPAACICALRIQHRGPGARSLADLRQARASRDKTL